MHEIISYLIWMFLFWLSFISTLFYFPFNCSHGESWIWECLHETYHEREKCDEVFIIISLNDSLSQWFIKIFKCLVSERKIFFHKKVRIILFKRYCRRCQNFHCLKWQWYTYPTWNLMKDKDGFILWKFLIGHPC